MRVTSIVFAVIFSLLAVGWGGTRIVDNILFDRGAGGYLKRAADANTVPLAEENLAIAVSYLKQHGLTSGYTSIMYNTPDEDIGFWYKNLSASLDELRTVRPDATQLEKSNLLIKLRETLLDHGKLTEVTAPQGISIYPFNGLFVFWAIISIVLAILSWFAAAIINDW